MVLSHARRGPSQPLIMAALILASLGVFAACTPAPARSDDVNALGSVSEHLDEASSAVTTAQLAVRSRAAGRLPAVTGDATIGDATETATGAVHGIGTLVIAADDAQRARDDALDAASGAVGPVAAARTWLGRPSTSAQGVLQALDEAGSTLDEANDAVQHARSDLVAQ